MENMPQYLATGLAVGIVYALVALGFVLIYKSSKVLNLAGGSLLMLGAYFCYSLATWAGLPMWLAIVVTIVLSFFMGMGIERVILRRMIGQPVLTIIMLTIVLGMAIDALSVAIWGPVCVSLGVATTSEVVKLGPVRLGIPYVYAFFASIVVFAGVYFFYQRSRLGLAMRATADDETAAHSMGVSGKRIYSMTWAIACLVAAVGGIFLAMLYGVSPQLSLVGLAILPVVILGGLESIGGAMVGALIVGVLQSLAAGYIDQYVGGGMKDIVPYIILLLILIFKPYGLFGLIRIERV